MFVCLFLALVTYNVYISNRLMRGRQRLRRRRICTRQVFEIERSCILVAYCLGGLRITSSLLFIFQRVKYPQVKVSQVTKRKGLLRKKDKLDQRKGRERKIAPGKLYPISRLLHPFQEAIHILFVLCIFISGIPLFTKNNN